MGESAEHLSTPAICRAIRTGKLLTFRYGDRRHVVEPYALGIGRRGRALLRAYDVWGADTTRRWRLFEVERIAGLRTASESVSRRRPGYGARDPGMNRVWVTRDM
jgi:predicted DNA-binding transcriptional regulator YafY